LGAFLGEIALRNFLGIANPGNVQALRGTHQTTAAFNPVVIPASGLEPDERPDS